MDCSKGMSGESLRLMTLRACSASTRVAMLCGVSSSNQPSCTASTEVALNRAAGLREAPRPLYTCDMAVLYIHTGRDASP